MGGGGGGGGYWILAKIEKPEGVGVWIFSGTVHSVKRTIFKLKQDRECLKHSTENIKLNSNKNFPWKQTNRSLIFDKNPY